MTRSISKLLLDTAELRAGSVITEREIMALKKRWRPLGRSKAPVYPYTECGAFMEHGPFRISPEQAAKGKAWLHSMVFTKAGAERCTAWTRDNIIPERVKIVAHISHFELVDWHWDTSAGGCSWPFPIYRVHGENGNGFDYVSRAWTSGSSEVIL